MESKRISLDGVETDFIAYDNGRIFDERLREFVEPVVLKDYAYVKVWFRRKEYKLILKDIIAELFLEKPEGCSKVEYITDDVSNNSVYNLQYVPDDKTETRGITTVYSEVPWGVNHDEQKIHQVCKMIAEGYRNKDIVEATGVNRYVIKRIRYYNNWAYIARQYGIKSPKQETDDDWSPEIAKKIADLYREDPERTTPDIAKLMNRPMTRRLATRCRAIKYKVRKELGLLIDENGEA